MLHSVASVYNVIVGQLGVSVLASPAMFVKERKVGGIISTMVVARDQQKLLVVFVLVNGIMPIVIVMQGIGVLMRVWEMWLGLAEGQ